MNQYLLTYLLLGIIPAILLSLWWHKVWFMKIAFFFIVYPLYPLFVALWVWDVIRSVKNNIRCAWCGEAVNFRDPESTKEHVKKCKEHPTLTRIAELEEELALCREANERFSQVFSVSIPKNVVSKLVKRNKIPKNGKGNPCSTADAGSQGTPDGAGL